MIVEDIKEQTGGYTKSSAWYVNALESALADLQVEDSDTIDTGGITLGSLFFFSYSVAYPEKYPFWDIQPLAVALRFDGDGFLGCNLHYINPDYRDAVAESLLNSGGGSVVPKNSIHKYLFSGMGTLYKVPKTEDWGGISLLPTERFISKSGRTYPKNRAFNWRK